MFDRYAEVAVRLPLDGTYTYRLGAGQAEVGTRVSVDFNGRQIDGIITELSSAVPDYAVRDVLEVLDDFPVLTADQLELGRWMAGYYLAGIGECLFKMFPAVPKRKGRGKEEEQKAEETARPELTAEQALAFNGIMADMERGAGVHLLHGITGSGKTEVYIRVIQESLARGRGALLLVPEIALTVQLIERLRQVFGAELALLHSALPAARRFRAYRSLLEGRARVGVGTRSAVFAPVPQLGVIVLDEEHDGSYKEHSAPRYHARQVAFYRGRTTGSVLLLGSATPALETRYGAQTGSLTYHRLSSRATGAPLPEVRIVPAPPPDIPISGELLRELELNLKAGRQSLLLLNRRGYFPFLFCKQCRESLLCPNCTVTLSLHRDGRLICHYCGYGRQNRNTCDRCGSPVERLGSGTQKLEEYVLGLYPEMRLERLDTDTASRAGVLTASIGRLLSGDLDVLVGTQMIAKGLDAPNVTLVGVLQADMALNMPDFRAAERTFSLLTQVAGRAGRADFRGRVIFEANNLESPILEFARRQDYEAFYEGELEDRRPAFYPPFSRIIRFLARAPEADRARAAITAVLAILEEVAGDLPEGHRPQILGPVAAPIERLHNQYRFHIVLKCAGTDPLRRALRPRLADLRATASKPNVHLEVDFDPTDLF